MSRSRRQWVRCVGAGANRLYWGAGDSLLLWWQRGQGCTHYSESRQVFCWPLTWLRHHWKYYRIEIETKSKLCLQTKGGVFNYNIWNCYTALLGLALGGPIWRFIVYRQFFGSDRSSRNANVCLSVRAKLVKSSQSSSFLGKEQSEQQ